MRQGIIAGIALIVFGGGALWLGIAVFRNAEKVVTDARQQLHAMFSESMPTLFTTEPRPTAARIAGLAFAALGLILVGLGMVFAITGS